MTMKNTDNFAFGDIVLALVPYTDGVWNKLRPVVVLAKDRNDYVCLKITSQTEKKFWFDLQIEPDKENNLKCSSLIQITKVMSHTRQVLHCKLGALSLHDRENVKNTLKTFINGL
jgi:mRNA-degrading endonuclease toxin of MazEF toxin-antitoxin module